MAHVWIVFVMIYFEILMLACKKAGVTSWDWQINFPGQYLVVPLGKANVKTMPSRTIRYLDSPFPNGSFMALYIGLYSHKPQWDQEKVSYSNIQEEYELKSVFKHLTSRKNWCQWLLPEKIPSFLALRWSVPEKRLIFSQTSPVSQLGRLVNLSVRRTDGEWMAGWWFGTFFVFLYIYIFGIIIPIG